MAPVATNENASSEPTQAERIEALKNDSQVFNPFYSPSIGDDGDDKYEFANFKVYSPRLSLEVYSFNLFSAVFPSPVLGAFEGGLCQ
jgi:sulfonate dioxygenase